MWTSMILSGLPNVKNELSRKSQHRKIHECYSEEPCYAFRKKSRNSKKSYDIGELCIVSEYMDAISRVGAGLLVIAMQNAKTTGNISKLE